MPNPMLTFPTLHVGHDPLATDVDFWLLFWGIPYEVHAIGEP